MGARTRQGACPLHPFMIFSFTLRMKEKIFNSAPGVSRRFYVEPLGFDCDLRKGKSD
jgi:hypothetical protein